MNIAVSGGICVSQTHLILFYYILYIEIILTCGYICADLVKNKISEYFHSTKYFAFTFCRYLIYFLFVLCLVKFKMYYYVKFGE